MRNYLDKCSIILGYIVLISLLLSCAQNEDFENPLDPRNWRTSGSPLGLTLSPGDKQIVVFWYGAGLDGITKYKIYRRFTGDPDSLFKLVGEVDLKLNPITGKETKVYEYIDKSGLENDTVDVTTGGQLYYVYRITYVDSDGEETPSDINKPGIPEVQATPSLAPPPPEVTIGKPQEDLRIKLIWDSYQPPDDIAGYRIYAGIVKTGEEPELTLLDDKKVDPVTGPVPGEQFYVDYAFQGDNVTKAYKVVAYDKFGVESPSKVFQATSPNLPPSKPRVQYKYTFFLFKPTYQIDVWWDKNPEPDIDGYRLYTLSENGVWVTRKTFNKNETKYTELAERYIVVEGEIQPRLYRLVAYDKTPRHEDGRVIDDESEPAMIEP
jgi:hypothetical protein